MGRRAVYQDAKEPAQLHALKVDATPVVMTQNAKAIRTVSNNAVVMNICRESKCCEKWSCVWVLPNKNGHYFIVCSCGASNPADEE